MTSNYLPALQALLPHGMCWTRDPGAVLTKLLDALAQEFGRVEDRAVELIEEADPRTTDELLEDWERTAGLPDTCHAPSTTEGRVLALVAKLTGRGGQHEGHYEDLADDVGYDVTIDRDPYSPFVPGSGVGDSLTQDTWQAAWRVITESGDEDQLLECVFRANAQAHTWVEFDYGGGVVDGYEVLTTVDGSYHTGVTISLVDGDVLGVEAWIVARERTGSERALYHIECLAYHEGVSTVQGLQTHALIESDAAYAAQFSDSTPNDIKIRVLGKAATTVDWKIRYRYILLQSAA